MRLRIIATCFNVYHALSTTRNLHHRGGPRKTVNGDIAFTYSFKAKKEMFLYSWNRDFGTFTGFKIHLIRKLHF